MTFQQALNQLKTTGTLSTNLLKPLGIPFEHFLRYAQLNDAAAQRALGRLVYKLENRNK